MRRLLRAILVLTVLNGCTNPDGSVDALGTLGLVAGAAAIGALALALDDDNDHGSSHHSAASNRGDHDRRFSRSEKSRILRVGCQKRYGGPQGPGARDYERCMDGQREAGWKDGCAQTFGADVRRRRACEEEF